MKVKEVVYFLKEQDPHGEVVLCRAEGIGGKFLLMKEDIAQIRVGMPKYQDIHCERDRYMLCVTDAIKSYSPCKELKDEN